MKVRLAKDPQRLDARLAELQRELAQAGARAARADNLRQQLTGQRQAILKLMRSRVAELALQFLEQDARRLGGFRDWATDPKQRSILQLFLASKSDTEATGAPKKKRGRPAGKKVAVPRAGGRSARAASVGSAG